MIRSVSVLLFALLPAVHSLAFVTTSSSTRSLGGFAAFKPTNQVPKGDNSVVLHALAIKNDVEPSKHIIEEYEFVNEDDDSMVKEMRNEMVDIVYQRSLERLTGFDSQ